MSSREDLPVARADVSPPQTQSKAAQISHRNGNVCTKHEDPRARLYSPLMAVPSMSSIMIAKLLSPEQNMLHVGEVRHDRQPPIPKPCQNVAVLFFS